MTANDNERAVRVVIAREDIPALCVCLLIVFLIAACIVVIPNLMVPR